MGCRHFAGLFERTEMTNGAGPISFANEAAKDVAALASERSHAAGKRVKRESLFL
jgi:hypothetical protein